MRCSAAVRGVSGALFWIDDHQPERRLEMDGLSLPDPAGFLSSMAESMVVLTGAGLRLGLEVTEEELPEEEELERGRPGGGATPPPPLR